MNVVERLCKDKVAIFLFHGVVDKNDYRVRNYTGKHLTKDVFYGHMKALKAHGTPVSMEQVVGHIHERKAFPAGAFAVTFDDGFENNYSVARPILKEFKIPAAIYVTTGFIEHNAMSWIDRVEYCFEYAKVAAVKLPWKTQISPMASFNERRMVLEDIRSHVKRDQSIDIDAFVADIFAQCRMEEVKDSNDPLDLKMSWQQIKELGKTSDFIIGGHTHTHRTMSYLSTPDLYKEVDVSLKLLQEKGDIPQRHYSYPEGLKHCYSPGVIDCLKSRGIVCSPTAEEGTNGIEDDPFQLKRIFVMS